MLILLVIFLCLFIPLAMLILHLIWPRVNVQGFLAVLTALAGWVLIILARPELTRTILLPQWQPATLFLLSPTLLIDNPSWYFTLALISLALSAVITSIAQLGQSTRANPNNNPQASASGASGVLGDIQQNLAGTNKIEGQPKTDALLWASILALTSFGLLAVTAGNLLTVLLAWTSLDIIELVILLGQMQQSKIRERIILVFSAKMAGLCLALIAGVILWSRGSLLIFEDITPPVSTLLVIAAGLRLGVLPLHLPFTRGLPINRNLGSVLRLIPASANFILLVRISGVGVSDPFTPYLLGFSALAGLYASFSWLRVKNELEGRPYWLVGTSSLVIIAALLHQPMACLAWGIASLLSGGLIFSMSLRHKNLLPILLLGLLNLSALPFTPTWQGVAIYQFTSFVDVPLTLFAVFSVMFLFIQAFLFMGYMRHILKGIYPIGELSSEQAERWVWFLYPLGLIFTVITHLLIGWFIYPDLHEVVVSGWLIGPISLVIVGFTSYFIWRFPNLYHPTIDPDLRSAWDRLFSLEWLYRFLWRVFRTLLKTFSLVSRILEGDGGLLWALVLFGLIFVFMQR
jgi:hypothetical protein